MTVPQQKAPDLTFSGKSCAFYLAAPETAVIVNLAIHLERPLLVEGEAGCGKTRLAAAVAEELELADRLIVITVKSTMQAKDLLYRFDALRRLQDAQNPGNQRARSVYPYLTLEPLGYAIREGKPCVVLIDEIDKADIDFPNDLLDVLDRFEFDIDDLPREESDACLEHKGFARHVAGPLQGVRPLVIITSNREKQLPEPFLRRCLYVQLDFPDDPAILAEIVRRNLAVHQEDVADELIAGAVERFCEVRERAQASGAQKLPATSELVDWVRVLHWQQRNSASVVSQPLTVADQAVLFKIRHDLERYRAHIAAEASR
ncbi:MAG: MoxR family ATPase [Candidatus Accumulibacter sp.]|uniref:AAA family ATPase n=1 Tax=Accumulibacter sp. TaxID=2053492 RepID=UPI0025F5AC45|nr:MoxR family ATPase [Accumulibacter sp.]MCM8599217.1 MoxR family ATPase [Accumulibacter sp.]